MNSLTWAMDFNVFSQMMLLIKEWLFRLLDMVDTVVVNHRKTSLERASVKFQSKVNSSKDNLNSEDLHNLKIKS